MPVPPVVWLFLPLAAAAVFGLVGPRLAARLSPAIATWLLSVGSASVAASGLIVLLLVTVTMVGELPGVAGMGHWSPDWLRAGLPYGRALGIAGVVLLGVQLVVFVRGARRHGRALLRAWAACRDAPGSLVVLPDPGVLAFAVPGWPGRIVVSDGLLRSCGASERRAVLAHEQAHLDGRHDLHVTAALLAASLNPFLAGVPAAIRLTTERWADEAAARATGDRRLVARTIEWVARAAGPGVPRALMTLGASDGDTFRRVAALLDHPPRRHPVVVAALVGLAVLAVTATVIAAIHTDHVFQSAQRAYALTSRSSGWSALLPVLPT